MLAGYRTPIVAVICLFVHALIWCRLGVGITNPAIIIFLDLRSADASRFGRRTDPQTQMAGFCKAHSFSIKSCFSISAAGDNGRRPARSLDQSIAGGDDVAYEVIGSY